VSDEPEDEVGGAGADGGDDDGRVEGIGHDSAVHLLCDVHIRHIPVLDACVGRSTFSQSGLGTKGETQWGESKYGFRTGQLVLALDEHADREAAEDGQHQDADDAAWSIYIPNILEEPNTHACMHAPYYNEAGSEPKRPAWRKAQGRANEPAPTTALMIDADACSALHSTAQGKRQRR
jgi:hypothetical protein